MSTTTTTFNPFSVLNQQQQQLLKTLSTFSQLTQPKGMNNQNDALNALGVLFPSDSNLSTYAVGKELSALYDSSAFVPNVNVNFSVPQAQESAEISESEQTSQNNSGSSKKAVKQQKNPEESECSISDESRTWSFLPLAENSPLTRKGMTQQEVEKAIQVVIATRSEGKYKNTVPERMYSSLKYEIIIRICRKCCFNFPLEKAKRKSFSNNNGDNKKTMNKKSGKSADKDEANEDQIPNNCNVLMAKIEIVDPEKTEEVILKTNGQQLLKGISTLNSLNLDAKPFNDEVMEECLSSKLKVQFTDVSYHHSKKYFAFKISIYDPALNITEPLAVTVSPAFQVFARRPSQNGRNGQTDKPKSIFSSPLSSSGIVKMEDKEMKIENETTNSIDEVKTETITEQEPTEKDQSVISSETTEDVEIKVKPEPKRETEMVIETTLEPLPTTSTEPAAESTTQVESEKKEKDLTSPSSSSTKNKLAKQSSKKKDSIKPKIEKKSAKKRKHSETEEDASEDKERKEDKEARRAAKKKRTEHKEIKVKSEPIPQITVQHITEDNIMEELTRILSNKQEKTLDTLKSLIDVLANAKEEMQYSEKDEFENYAREKLNIKECSRHSMMNTDEQNAVDFSLNSSSFYHSQMIAPEQDSTRTQENEDKYNESENESIFMSFLNPVKSENNNNSNEFSDLFF